MKKFLATQFFKFSKMKVVHSIPGRIRLSVPGLKMVDSSFIHFEEELIEILKELRGVNDISLSSVSGKALVLYDPTIASEESILKKFSATWDTLIDTLLQVDPNTVVTDELIKSYIPQLQAIVVEANKGV